jgi:glycosyltransferase involved in cell wall biosynthesis
MKRNETMHSVLHVSKFLPPPYAGIEAHVDQLLPALMPSYEPTLLVSELGLFKRPGAPRPFPVLSARTLARIASTAISPSMVTQMRSWAKDHPAAPIHLHLPNPMADIASWCLPKSTPLVLTWHSDIVRQSQLLKLYWPLLRRLLLRADRIIAFTPKHIESSTQLGVVDPEKLRVVPVAIDPQRVALTHPVEQAVRQWRERFAGRKIVLAVGRHVYYKGFEFLIAALASMPRTTQLILVGTGPLTRSLKLQAEQAGLNDRIAFLGGVDDTQLVALMHVCDVFCLPSVERSEAFGLATAEAMLCGKPAVVCQLGNGVNYLNRDGVTGLTVEPRNSLALADALAKLIESDALRLSFGAAAKNWVETEFSIEKMRQGTFAVYEEAIVHRRARSV